MLKSEADLDLLKYYDTAEALTVYIIIPQRDPDFDSRRIVSFQGPTRRTNGSGTRPASVS